MAFFQSLGVVTLFNDISWYTNIFDTFRRYESSAAEC